MVMGHLRGDRNRSMIVGMRRARGLVVAGVAFAAGVLAGLLIADHPSDTTQGRSGESAVRVETNATGFRSYRSRQVFHFSFPRNERWPPQTPKRKR